MSTYIEYRRYMFKDDTNKQLVYMDDHAYKHVTRYDEYESRRWGMITIPYDNMEKCRDLAALAYEEGYALRCGKQISGKTYIRAWNKAYKHAMPVECLPIMFNIKMLWDMPPGVNSYGMARAWMLGFYGQVARKVYENVNLVVYDTPIDEPQISRMNRYNYLSFLRLWEITKQDSHANVRIVVAKVGEKPMG
jgi:hypothetical protein